MSEHVIAQQRVRRRGAEIRDADMATEAAADIAHCGMDIKLEPVDVETQQMDCDAVVKEEVTVEAGVPQEALEQLYADHVIKQEMAIGPVVLRRCPTSDADASTECTLYTSKTSKSSTSAVMSQSEESPLHMRVCEYTHVFVLKRKLSAKNGLSQQTQIHTAKKLFGCKISKKQLPKKNTLPLHERIHTGQKPFSCIICKKQYSMKCHLTIHERIHTGEKPFCCKICKKQFRTKGHFNAHERMHTREKPFCCIICKKLFCMKSNLTAHERLHTGEKPFCCNICRKQFAFKGHLTQHQKSHTRDNTYNVNK